MLILYILLIAYILAVNFYAFLLVKSLRDKEKESENTSLPQPTPDFLNAPVQKPPQKYLGKLFITGILGGAITIYVCMFILKYKRSELLLMVGMPLLGVLNVYFWVLLFRSGFTFFMIR
ncbi:MAG: hypothetical protein IJF64_01235 [Clostridia bacterium]|nr:hypothetical protein [Clostridia bacterium]